MWGGVKIKSDAVKSISRGNFQIIRVVKKGCVHMGLFLEQKIESAIKLLREHEPEEGYFLAFSGGKDSITIYQLAKL